jgi:hypothetical protein
MKCGWTRICGPHYPHTYRKWRMTKHCSGCQHPWGLMENDLGLVVLKCHECGATRRVRPGILADLLALRQPGGSPEPGQHK